MLWCAVSAAAQPKLNAPMVGIARDSRQQLRMVHGLTGTFVLHNVIGENAVEWAFDGENGLAVTKSQLLILGAEGKVLATRSIPEGGTVAASQAVFLPAENELWLSGPKGLAAKVPVNPDLIGGRVLAVGSMQGHSVALAVCREAALWLLSIDTQKGTLLEESPQPEKISASACHSNGTRSLLLLSDRFLVATPHGLLVRTTAGVERTIPGAATHLARAGAGWVEMETGGAVHMIRITADGEKVYQLPAAKERE